MSISLRQSDIILAILIFFLTFLNRDSETAIDGRNYFYSQLKVCLPLSKQIATNITNSRRSRVNISVVVYMEHKLRDQIRGVLLIPPPSLQCVPATNHSWNLIITQRKKLIWLNYRVFTSL